MADDSQPGGGYRVVLLGACCAGKTTLAAALGDDLVVVESDDAVLAAAGGVWPADLGEVHRLVIETAEQALALDHVVLLTSFVPTEDLRAARGSGAVVAVLDVPRVELERRNRERAASGGHGDMSHWFDEQLANYEELAAAGLIDAVVDATAPVADVVMTVRSLVGR